MSEQSGIRDRRRAETRSAIVRAATRLFLDRGVARTSIDDIAAGAGIARRTFFLHFPSKEDVLFHYLEGHISRAARALEDLPPGAEAHQGVQAVMAVLLDLFEDPSAGTDELADLRAELIATSRGLPASLALRLQRAQSALADALRERFPDPAGWPLLSAHLGACMGAAAAAALAVERPEARAGAIREAVDRASAGFTV
ncbi:TetR/AcrR family transcriptional regulator [Brachybacterium sp. YJGR34]|uniref:TetR/AcrR family transcriptional regulator n=1 Tax=Brachybacterium sp. YJGR34 TaxID=2059911 RepID=UPI000E0A0CF2|nr:TetR/AcrR family transcriptional regulator [Brachybacterium sp. YJGR34]